MTPRRGRTWSSIDGVLAHVGVEALSGDASRFESAEKVADRRLESFLLQIRGVDLDEQRPQRLDAGANRSGRVEGLSWFDRIAATLRSESQRDPGQLLDDAVMEIARDPTAFGIGSFESVPKQAFCSRWLDWRRRAIDHANGIWINSSTINATVYFVMANCAHR